MPDADQPDADQPELVPLPDSARRLPAGAVRVGDAPADEQVLVSVVVRRRTTSAEPAVAPADAETDAATDPVERRRRQRAAYAEQAGADPADLRAVAGYASAHDLTVQVSDAGRRTVTLSGTAAAMGRAFGVDLGRYQAAEVTYRGREGELRVPAELADVIVAVLGLDDRPQAHSRLRAGAELHEPDLPTPSDTPSLAAPTAPVPAPLWTTQVAALYEFPTGSTGTGETIAIIELGGGYRDAELAAYFRKAGVTAPKVVAVSVDQGSNTPGGSADGEVLLDIELAGTVAPGADIVVYFADNSDRGFLDAITTAVHDQTHVPSVISISWGAREAAWTRQSLTQFDQAFADAAALGVTVLAAAGDHGAGDGGGDGKVHADFPAASPHVVACGGTTLVAAQGAVVSEVVWNDADGWATGGGVSDVFDQPAHQHGFGVPPSLNGGTATRRGLPDVAGNADITSGYIVLVHGKWTAIGGTSAVAPLYAGLVALLNSSLGAPVGDLNPKLYAAATAGAASVFRDITSGNNAVPATPDFGPAAPGYSAGSGWDACTGLGSIRGSGLLTYLKAPATPSGHRPTAH